MDITTLDALKQQLPIELLIASQISASELLEVAYYKLQNAPALAKKVRLNGVEMRSLTQGCAQHLAHFAITAQSVLETLPKMRQAVQRDAIKLALALMKVVTKWVTDMKHDAISTRERCQNLIGSVNTNIGDVKIERKSMQAKIAENRLEEEAVKKKIRTLQDSSAVLQQTKAKVTSEIDSLNRSLQDIRNARPNVETGFLEDVGDFIGGLFGGGGKEARLREARAALNDKQESFQREIDTMRNSLVNTEMRINEIKQSEVDAAHRRRVLQQLRDDIGDPELLVAAVSSLLNVDKMLQELIKFWEKMELCIQVLSQGADVMGPILDFIITDPRTKDMFYNELESADRRWQVFKLICIQYNKEVEKQIPSMYSFLNENMTKKQQEQRTKLIMASNGL